METAKHILQETSARQGWHLETERDLVCRFIDWNCAGSYSVHAAYEEFKKFVAEFEGLCQRLGDINSALWRIDERAASAQMLVALQEVERNFRTVRAGVCELPADSIVAVKNAIIRADPKSTEKASP